MTSSHQAIRTGVTLSETDFRKLAEVHRPLRSFDELPSPLMPNYASADSWAALWPRADEADAAPPNTAYPEAQDSAPADVFFVHPTCYTKKDYWNGPIDDPDVKNTVSFMMMYLASVFNAAARVYAPRYRQFTLFSVVEKETTSGMRAIELAYSDVERAFDYYLEKLNEGRPFILASHSQGSMHSSRLLQTRIVGTPIQSRLVAAYLVGMAIPNNLRGIEPARSATDAGVYINWNSLTADADPRFFTEDKLEELLDLLQGEPMPPVVWCFRATNSVAPFRNISLTLLPCRLGLEKLDQNDYLPLEIHVPTNLRARKATAFDGAFQPYWSPGGLSCPRNECPGEPGLPEVVVPGKSTDHVNGLTYRHAKVPVIS